VLYIEDGDIFKPFAGVIRMERRDGQIKAGWHFPILHDNPEKYPDGCYLWQDKNDDQTVQEDEIYFWEPSWQAVRLLAWLDRDLNAWCDAGILFSPTHIDEKGRPYYDFSQPIPTPTGPFLGVYLNEEGTELYARDMHNGIFARWDKEDASLMWMYDRITTWHESVGFPVVTPGKLHGLTTHLGVAGEFTGAVTYFNPYHIFTTDGIYVTALLRDVRDGKGFDENVVCSESHQGQLVKLTMPRGASSAGVQESRSSGVQNGDMIDRYFLLAGASDARIMEIFGLDTVKRLEGGTYIHTEEMVEKTLRAQQDYDHVAAKSKALGIMWHRHWMQNPSFKRVVDNARSFVVKVSHDMEPTTNLFVRYTMTTDIPLVNSIADEKYLFKGGNCLDIQIGVQESRSSGVQNDEIYPMRLLVTRQNDKTKAMLYIKTMPQKQEGSHSGLLNSWTPELLSPFTFTSPTGEETFAHIEDVSDRVTLEYHQQPNGFMALVGIPQELLGIEIKTGLPLAMDIGYIFGNKEGNQATSRAYWSNNSFTANILHDIPHESRLEPAEWRKAVIQ